MTQPQQSVRHRAYIRWRNTRLSLAISNRCWRCLIWGAMHD